MKEIEFRNISASKLRIYLLCPRQYYYAYAEGIFQKETSATIFGSYIHAVLNDYLRHLLKTGKDKDLKALYSIVTDKKSEYPTIPETGSLSFFEGDIILNRFASKKIDPQKIYGVEKLFNLPFVYDPEIHLTGRIDRIDIESDNEGNTLLHLIDYKTGKNKLNQEELKEDIQMKFYVLAAYFLYRKSYDKFRVTLYYLKDTSLVSFETTYNEDYAEELSGHIKTIKNDAGYKKLIAPHCYRCPAFKLCKPDKTRIKK